MLMTCSGIFCSVGRILIQCGHGKGLPIVELEKIQSTIGHKGDINWMSLSLMELVSSEYGGNVKEGGRPIELEMGLNQVCIWFLDNYI